MVNNQRGMILVVGLMLLLVVTGIGLAIMNSSIFELQISGNHRSSNQAFYVAEAGAEDARTRINVSKSSLPINDTDLTNPNWEVVIGTQERANEKGLGSVARYDKLNASLDYFVDVKHKVDASNQVLRWGDANKDGIPEENTTFGSIIYVINSEGNIPDGGKKRIRTEVTHFPPINVPSSLYTKATTKIQGSSTKIDGNDGCGAGSLPGIISHQNVTITGSPTINGSPAYVENSPLNVDVAKMIESLRDYANYSYENGSGTTRSGMNWGSPWLPNVESVSSCDANNIVYHHGSVKFTGGTTGCGILLVEGDLELNGGFVWHGVILVTGCVKYTGGGEKNVTGALLAGGTTDVDVVGGNAAILYCSTAIKKQTDNLPLTILRWAELR